MTSAETANADVLHALHTTPPRYGTNPLSGTVTPIKQDTNTIVGTGTRFLTELAACSSKTGNSKAFSCTWKGSLPMPGMSGRDPVLAAGCSLCCRASLDVNRFGPVPLLLGRQPVDATNCPVRVFRRLFYNAGAKRMDIGGEQPLIWFWWNTPDGPGTGRLLNYMASGPGRTLT